MKLRSSRTPPPMNSYIMQYLIVDKIVIESLLKKWIFTAKFKFLFSFLICNMGTYSPLY